MGGNRSERCGKSILHHTFASSDAWRAEMRDFGGEPIVVLWARESDGNAVKSLARLDEHEGVITRVRYYFFCPETLAEVCNEWFSGEDQRLPADMELARFTCTPQLS